MSMQDPNRPARPRPGQAAPAGRPATPIVAIVIAAIAGLVGLVILRDVKNDSGAGPADNIEIPDTTEPITDDTSVPGDSTVDTTLPVLTRTGATVVVANASAKKGAAGALTDELKARGYDAAKAFTANSGTLNDITQVLATPGDAAALAVAKAPMAIADPFRACATSARRAVSPFSNGAASLASICAACSSNNRSSSSSSSGSPKVWRDR